MHCVEGLGYTSKYGNLPKYFHFCTAILSIFGNAPLTLKQDTQHVSSTIPYFLLLFFGTATPFIYGDAPWTLQHHPQHCHQPSPIFSPYFIAIFHFCIATIPIFGNPMSSPPIPYFLLISPLFYCYFSVESPPISIFGSALLDPENKKSQVFC
jgi:hypothetical protein